MLCRATRSTAPTIGTVRVWSARARLRRRDVPLAGVAKCGKRCTDLSPTLYHRSCRLSSQQGKGLHPLARSHMRPLAHTRSRGRVQGAATGTRRASRARVLPSVGSSGDPPPNGRPWLGRLRASGTVSGGEMYVRGPELVWPSSARLSTPAQRGIHCKSGPATVADLISKTCRDAMRAAFDKSKSWCASAGSAARASSAP